MENITPQKFYKNLGAEGLALRKKPEQTKSELNFFKRLLNKRQKILDLACGYGRFTIPLSKAGYNIEGLDLSSNLLEKAREEAKKQNLTIKFIQGDMTKLPYENEIFDAIICMWSAFIELTEGKDQIKALNEMLRVLKNKGFAFIEIPVPQKASKNLNTKRKD